MKDNPFAVKVPRGAKAWFALGFKILLVLAVIPVLDGLQAIGRGNSDMLPGLVTLALGLVLVLVGIGGYIAVGEEDEHENNA